MGENTAAGPHDGTASNGANLSAIRSLKKTWLMGFKDDLKQTLAL